MADSIKAGENNPEDGNDPKVGNPPPEGEPEGKLKKFELENELGEIISHELDLSSEDAIKDLILKSSSSDLLKEDIEVLTAQLEAERARSGKHSKEAEELDKLRTLSRREKLEWALKEEGGVEEFLRKEREEWERLADMSPAEKKEYEFNKADNEKAKELKKLRELVQGREKEKEEQASREREEAFKSQMKDGFSRHIIKGEGWQIRAANSDILASAQESMRELKKDGVKITQTIINREFRRAAAKVKKEMKREVESLKEKTREEQLKDATQKAQENPEAGRMGGGDTGDAAILARWRKDYAEGKITLKHIAREAKQDPRLYDLMTKVFDS